MPGINGMLVFLLALAVQVCVSGLRPFWAGLILPALYEGLIWVTMAGYAQVYGRWQPEPVAGVPGGQRACRRPAGGLAGDPLLEREAGALGPLRRAGQPGRFGVIRTLQADGRRNPGGHRPVFSFLKLFEKRSAVFEQNHAAVTCPPGPGAGPSFPSDRSGCRGGPGPGPAV